MALTDTLESKATATLDANAPSFGPSNQITASSLSSSPSLREAPAAIPTDFTSFVNSLTPDTSALTKSGDKLRSDISDTFTDLEGKGARQLEVEQDLGLPEDRQRLREINLQIAQLKGEFDKAIVNEEGAVRPQEFITGRQDFLQKKSAVMVGALTSVAQALQGNITLAEQTADSTIEKEFADEEARLRRLEFEYTENKDALEKADKKGADELALYIAERTRVLDDKKEERKGVLSFAQMAAVNGAPNSVVSRIAAASSQEEALSLMGSWSVKGGGMAGGSAGYGLPLSSSEQKEVRERITGNRELSSLLQQYEDLVRTHGFETGMTKASAEVLGQYDALRGRITTALKKAETLGTLDQGVTQLVTQLIGEPLEGGVVPGFGKPGNYGNRKSTRILSAIEQQRELIDSNVARDETLLQSGFELLSSISGLVGEDDLAEINAIFGTEASTAAFSPANFYSYGSH